MKFDWKPSYTLKHFLDYVWSFYGNDDPLYPIKDLKYSHLEQAWAVYKARLVIADKNNGKLDGRPYTWGYGDSIDRERMRDILLEDFCFEMEEQ